MDNSSGSRVGGLEALGKGGVVMDEDVRGAHDVRGAGGQHPRSACWFAWVSRPREVGGGVREALVAVLALPHTSCTVIWGGAQLIEWRRRIRAIARTIVINKE